MKVRIIEKGNENFTGLYGVFEFENGVSVHELNDMQVNLLASITSIETLDGKGVGPNFDSATKRNIEAAGEVVYKTSEQLAKERAESKEPDASVSDDFSEAKTSKHTQEELEAIADTRGLAGLREIAEPMGIRATSIAKMIELILKAQ